MVCFSVVFDEVVDGDSSTGKYNTPVKSKSLSSGKITAPSVALVSVVVDVSVGVFVDSLEEATEEVALVVEEVIVEIPSMLLDRVVDFSGTMSKQRPARKTCPFAEQ